MSSRLSFQLFIRFVTGPCQKRLQSTRYIAFWHKPPHFSTTLKMSSIGGAGIGAGLYAAVSTPTQGAAQPEDATDKAHHLKNGKGFTNPWDSYIESNAFQVFKTLIWLVGLGPNSGYLMTDV
jgi:hypothetical protein